MMELIRLEHYTHTHTHTHNLNRSHTEGWVEGEGLPHTMKSSVPCKLFCSLLVSPSGLQPGTAGVLSWRHH